MSVPPESLRALSRSEKQELLRRVLVEKISRSRTAPASFAQERLWFLDRMQGASGIYNVPAALRLSGALDAAALERALGEIVRRHEALRTTFAEADGVAVQVIAPFAGFALAVEDLFALAADAREAEVRRRAAEDAARPFDLAAGPLFRATLLRLADDEHVLLFCIHHVVSDGWSMGVLFRELSALYEAFRDGRPSPLPAPRTQYADFAERQRAELDGETLDRQLAYWKTALAGAPAMLELPADHPRPAVQSHAGAREVMDVSARLADRLEALGLDERATPYMVLLGAFQVLLAKYAGADDVVVGTAVSGRAEEGVEELIGFFVNTLALRTDLSGDPSFREVLRRVRAATLGAYANAEVPFERLVEELQPERSASHSPLFQVMFTLNDAQGARVDLPGIRAEDLGAELATAKFDLSLSFAPHARGLRGLLSYSTDLFERSTIRRMLEHLSRLLQQVADDADLPLSRLELMGAAERVQVLETWNRTDAEYPAASIHALFEEQARATPAAAAVVLGGETLAYAELNARANRLAHHLRGLGVGAETRVGLCMERGMEMMVSILAILKAGGAYVPLDLSYPAERLAWMLADAGVAVLLTDGSSPCAHAAADARIVRLGAERAEIDACPADDVAGSAAPNGLAYVMYTSGSTGTPRGVAVEHRNVVRLVRGAGYADFGADEVILQAAPVSFDASTLEIWGALLNGGRVVLMPGRTPSVEELGRTIVGHGVTTLWLTAGLFQVMVEERLDDLRGVRQLLAGGDVLPVEAVRRVRDRFPSLRLINGYGPTENTTFTCCHTVGETWSGGPVPIGGPISNTRVYVLDAAMRPVPIGVPGELYTGGDGVSRGYLGRPALTAEKFVPDPFSAARGARMYRTGDRVRWLADGTVEYLGRLDRQVKIRGFRIEPGEVASVLHRHPAVTDCAVIVREDAPGEKRLVAYVVGDADAEALREHLRRSLPEYMVPAAFVALDALPLTPNGKVDRRALPAPELASDEDAYVAPRTPVEQTLAAIWAEVLRVERVGAADDFFGLGGHSLMAMRIVSRIREVLGVELPVRDLFEGPTVARLAERVEALGGAATQAAAAQPVRAARETALPLSFAQERLWFLDRMQPDSAFYNIPAALRLSGALDADALGRALGEIVRRHEALRTTFPEADGRPVQVVHPFAGFRMPVEELSAPGPEAREAHVRHRAAEDAARPFDLAAGPLFRATLLRLADDDHVLLLCMHHVVSDGWSMGVFFRELSALYQAFRDGRPSPLPEPRTQYADYAVRQRTAGEVARLDAQLAYWKAQLAGAPALLELPADHPRPGVQTFRGTHEPVYFSPALTERLEALGRGEGATLYMVLLAAFQVLLARHAGRDDVVVGSPVAGRTRPEVEELIGFFVNTLVLRTDLSGDPSFRDVLRRVRAVTLGAYEHQEVPFERLVEELHPERSLSHSPLVQVSFTLRNTGDAEGALGDVQARRVAAELDVTKFDLTLGLAPDGRGLRGGMEYSTDLFERGTIRRMLEQLERVLEQAVEHPDRRISRLELMSGAERARIVGWNRTVARFPSDRCIHQLFEAQAARTPDAVAVVCGAESLSYRELDARANRLANHLRRRGVGPEVRVGICLERSLELMVSLLGVMKAGGAYVPVDPAHPAERIGYVLGDSGVDVVLVQARLAGRIPAGMARIAVDAEWPAIAAESAEAPESGVTADNLCYVIYTSGSTGRPKGVAMHHRGVCNYIHWGVRAYGADRGNGSPVFSSMAVDLTITNLLSLFAGRPVWLLAEEAPVEALAQALREGAGFGPIKITPVHLSLLTPLLTAEEARSAAHTLVVGADFLAAEPTVFWQENAPGVRLMNEYGPTETVVGCSAYVLPNGRHRAGPVPVGRPIQNLRFYVLDPHGQPVPVGLPGELYIGGVGVARGYLGRPGLSAEKFVPDPFAEAGARMYRTGDRARWLADGNLLVLGRTDNQVKIRGYRVELGEIEAELRRHPHVTGAIVVLREDRPGDRRLVAYVVGDVGTETLREHLRERLPEYMVPSAFVALETLPQTQTGKVDPRTLPAPEYGAATAGAAPRTGVEERVAAVWREVLGVERVGVHDNFFDLGGTSLLLYRVYSRLRELRADLKVVDLFRHPTVEALAGHLGAQPGAAAAHLAGSQSRAAGRRASLLALAGEA
jgi:amino acid adenylation domain-containing protein